MTPWEAGKCTSEAEVDSTVPLEGAGTCTSELEADSRPWAVEERGVARERNTA